jgi:hypothetical protein
MMSPRELDIAAGVAGREFELVTDFDGAFSRPHRKYFTRINLSLRIEVRDIQINHWRQFIKPTTNAGHSVLGVIHEVGRKSNYRHAGTSSNFSTTFRRLPVAS